MKYTKEQIKDTACQLVDMMGEYNGHKMSFDIYADSVFPFSVYFYRRSDGNHLGYNFSNQISLRLNMEGLKEWMDDNDLA